MAAFELVYRCDPSQDSRPAPPHDAAAARMRLDQGNRAFAALIEASTAAGGQLQRAVVPIDPAQIRNVAGAAAQRPFAAVLGCADARMPIELIFNAAMNDIFVVRVAGNGLGADVLGSLRYAIEHLGKSLKVIAVLGHSGCGAVSAAVDVFLDPSKYLALATNRSIRGILDPLATVVHASARRLRQAHGERVTQRPGYRSALIEMAVVTNAAFTAHTVHRVIREDAMGPVETTYGVYLLDSCTVWAPRIGTDDWSGLADAPAEIESFGPLGDAVAGHPRIAAILNAAR